MLPPVGRNWQPIYPNCMTQRHLSTFRQHKIANVNVPGKRTDIISTAKRLRKCNPK